MAHCLPPGIWPVIFAGMRLAELGSAPATPLIRLSAWLSVGSRNDSESIATFNAE